MYKVIKLVFCPIARIYYDIMVLASKFTWDSCERGASNNMKVLRPNVECTVYFRLVVQKTQYWISNWRSHSAKLSSWLNAIGQFIFQYCVMWTTDLKFGVHYVHITSSTEVIIIMWHPVYKRIVYLGDPPRRVCQAKILLPSAGCSQSGSLSSEAVQRGQG